MVASEDVYVTVTKDGYLKRTSQRSFAASNGQDFGMKDTDRMLHQFEMNTTDVLLLFTNKEATSIVRFTSCLILDGRTWASIYQI